MKEKKDLQPQKRLLPTAIRLTFEYDRDKINLINRQRVNMIIPTPQNPAPNRKRGFWIDIKNSKDQILYSRAQPNPIRYDVEVFSEKTGQNIVRRPALHSKGTFVILIPDLPEAHSIDFFSSPLEEKKAHEPAKKLATFALKEKYSKKEEKR